MHIVTGAAGFIGSNLVRRLNEAGIDNILAVDDLTQGDKFRNLRDARIADYMDHREFRELIRRGAAGLRPTALYHQGACADTTESDGRFMMDVNYVFSKELLHWALGYEAPMVYASSASVYGGTPQCQEDPRCEAPLNVYAYSKLQFDRYVRRLPRPLPSTVVGLRYFNVYGPNETYKGKMASTIHQFANQIRATGATKLFDGTEGYGPGEQRRDFVYVGDVVDVNHHFATGALADGIYNCGTGVDRSFNDIARTLISQMGRGRIEYIPFPESLRGKYQSFTRSDITQLRKAGYTRSFATLEEGISRFLDATKEG
ncbi:MAG: ADP-glyceromanno-heptose 6-epimerase [Planctomycetota bacterium]|nr:ADP-glyceromanno-heptose 6-epimerase [Planctomycetota bacterium]